MTRIGILLCHANLAEELLKTTRKILGHTETLYSFSNDRVTPELLFEEVYQFVRERASDEVVVLVDLRGGNCWKVGCRLWQQFPQIRVLSGVNLPMIVSYITKYQTQPFEKFVEIIEHDGHRGIVLDKPRN